MTAHIAPTLESLRVRRDAYAASGGEAAVIYDKLRDERHARLAQRIGWASSGAGLGNHCVAIVRLTPMVAVGLGALTAQPLK